MSDVSAPTRSRDDEPRGSSPLPGVMDLMLEGCQILGHDRRYLYLNRAAELQNRRPSSELLGRVYEEAWPGVERTDVFARIRRTLETRVPGHMRNKFEFPDGGRGWYDLRFEPIPEGVLILSVDVSEQVLERERARHLQEVLDAIRRVNQAIARERDPGALIARACDALVETRSYHAVWIALDPAERVPGLAAHAGFGHGFDAFREQLAGGWRPSCWAEAERANGAFTLLRQKGSCAECPLGAAAGRGPTGVARLRHRGRDLGVLGICWASDSRMSADESSLLSEVAADLGAALHALETERRRDAFEQIVTSSEDAMALVDREHRLVEASPSWLAITSYTAEQVEGLEMREVVGAEVYESLVREKLDAAFRGEIVSLETPGEIGERTGRYFETQIAPCRDTEGNVIRVVLSVRDVTRRRQDEEQLRARNALLATWLEATIDGILILDQANRHFAFNRRFGELWNVPAEVLTLRKDEEILEHVARNMPEPGAFVARVRQIVASREVVEQEELALADGRVFERSTAPILDADGRYLGRLWRFRDVTDRRLAEAHRAKLEERLLASQKMEAIGTLAGGVAHDFNNLLVVILNYVEFAITDLPAGSPMRGDLEQVKRAGERAAELTRQLLAFGRKQMMQPVPLDLNHTVEGVERMLRRILGEDVELRIRLAPGLGPVIADPGQLEQVLMNLVVNARDAMPRGGTLRIETSDEQLQHADDGVESAPPGRYARMDVSDTGIGMDEGTLAHIFEPFFTTKPMNKGTGLGLSTVYGIVRQSGGFLSVTSRPGEGSTFTLRLPVACTEAVPLPERRVPPARLSGTERLLVVEDEPALRELLVRFLRGAGYDVRTARDGADALNVFVAEDGAFDLVVTDVIMPNSSGAALARELRLRNPALRVLFMSGYSDDALARHGALDMDTHFLGKPFGSEELLARVRRVLDGSPPGPGPAAEDR